MSKREEQLIRILVRESIQLQEFKLGGFGGPGAKATSAAKVALAALFSDPTAEVAYDEAAQYIDTLEDAGDHEAVAFYRAKLKAHHTPAADAGRSVRSKDNMHFISRTKKNTR